MENIQDIASWQGSDPLTLRVTGTGEYVMNFLCNAVDNFYQAEQDHLEDIRQDCELEND